MTEISRPIFEAHTERRGDLSIVHASGEIDIASAPMLAERLETASGPGVQTLIVNLAAVKFLDSTGLGVLIECNERLRAEDDRIELRLVVSEPQITKVFAVTGLDDVFTIYPSLVAATSATA